MPNVNDLGESKYLKKEDVDPAVVCTIESYENVNIEADNKPPKMKFILWLKGITKQLPLNKDDREKALVLNKTNGNRIAKITGSTDFDGWIGKQIELFHDEMVEFGGELVGGIRARPLSSQPAQTPPNAQPQGETVQDDDIPF